MARVRIILRGIDKEDTSKKESSKKIFSVGKTIKKIDKEARKSGYCVEGYWFDSEDSEHNDESDPDEGSERNSELESKLNSELNNNLDSRRAEFADLANIKQESPVKLAREMAEKDASFINALRGVLKLGVIAIELLKYYGSKG